ncbi:unnamed protein product [Soboliphyme baturini]|uniref:Uncharacterized protein n=1 Tax=Soboliphyme baturini TaxID=241478 RepID=A0A183JB60_9BILA|nr:unnamed protein product [Soboliphyme baturini]
MNNFHKQETLMKLKKTVDSGLFIMRRTVEMTFTATRSVSCAERETALLRWVNFVLKPRLFDCNDDDSRTPSASELLSEMTTAEDASSSTEAQRRFSSILWITESTLNTVRAKAFRLAAKLQPMFAKIWGLIDSEKLVIRRDVKIQSDVGTSLRKEIYYY